MRPLSESELEWDEHDGVEGSFRQKKLGQTAGSEQLGCSLYELEPGCQPWSNHYHAANEEALYVLSGTGTVSLGDETCEVGAGDYVPCPADERGLHTIENTGDQPLRYLAFSTMNDPDVTVHPDIDKVGVYVGSAPGSGDERTLAGFFDMDDREHGSE